jgi:hypothetical protein
MKDHLEQNQDSLRGLTSWQLAGGMPPSGSPHVISAGESRAAIDGLKSKLDRLGARCHWSENERRYILDSDEKENEL